MPLLDRVYESLVNQVIEKLSHMKNVKAPPFVENFPFTTMMGIAERAKSGSALSEPLGSTRNFKDFRDLMFVPSMFPTVDGTPIDLSVTLGKRCAKPFTVPVPFMLSAYGYGVSVSKKVKIALAMGSTMANTACNSGEGGYVPEERQHASRYIVQYNRAGWGNKPEELRDCDMVEIRMSQGASAGDGFRIQAGSIDEELRDHLGLKEGEDAVMPARFPDINNESDLRRKVSELRDITEGIPVALKIAAGDIENDLDRALSAGVDVVVLDGAQGGTAGSPEITINNFGIPTLYALIGAERHLKKRGLRDRVSLIVSGGIRDSGDVLKAIALGADAVYIGYAALFALVYSQLEDLDPGTSPTEMELYEGKQTEKLNVEEAAASVANYLKATAQELECGVRCLGKQSLREVGPDDLVALNREMAEITGVRLAY